MSETGITFKNKEVMEFFGRIAKNNDDIEQRTTDYWSSITAPAMRSVLHHFSHQMGPDGKWQDWSQVYADHMASVGKSGNKILTDTGRLRQSLQMADTSSRIKRGELLFNPAQSDDGKPYAYNHDTGSGGQKQRKFMWLGKPTMNVIANITAAYLLGGLE